MNEVTITTEEYKDLLQVKFDYEHLKKLLQLYVNNGCGIYSSDLTTLCHLHGIEAKQDA